MSGPATSDMRPGQRLSIRDVAFDGFPADDGLWWLRWVDYGAATTTSRSSLLHLLFSRLPDGTRADALPLLDPDLAARQSAIHRAKAHVGLLPVLRIGLVVRAGTVVGELGAEVRQFRFEAPLHDERMELLLHADAVALDLRRRRRLMAFAEPSFEFGDRPGLLRPSDYPLPGVRDGRLLCFGPKGGSAGSPTLVLPCAEVVRVTYAPHAALARALIDRSWSRGVHEVLDMGRTGLFADGLGWQVAPLARLRMEHVAVAANLALNPVGRRRAILVHAEIQSARHGLLAASLPFEWQTLELDAACIRLRADADGEWWFGYAIERLRWPPAPMGPPQTIRWVPGGDRRPGQERRPGAGRPFPLGSGGNPPRPGRRVVQVADPRAAAPQEVAARGAVWLDAPDVVKAKKALSFVRDGRRAGLGRRRGVGGADQLAAGLGGSRQGPAPADPQSVAPGHASSPPSTHFQDVSAMLGRLVTSGALEASDVEAAERDDLERRGDIAAWAFPRVPVPARGPGKPRSHWYVRDFERKMPSGELSKEVRRAAMVRRIVASGRVAYWVEIEPRPYRHDRYRSLVFTTTGVMLIKAVIGRLLEVAARHAGVWPPPATVQRSVAADGRSGIGACAGWQHVRLKLGENAPERLRALAADAALAVIRKVLTR